MTLDSLTSRAFYSAGLAFVFGLIFIPMVMAFARKIGFVAKPRQDRWSSKPTALLGGIGIYLAFSAAAALLVHDYRAVFPIAAAATLMFVVGLVDDIIHMRPQYKLVAQIVAASLVLASGAVTELGSSWFALPLGMLFIVGITNAINLLDNMDGLSAGISAIAAAMLVWVALITGDQLVAVLASALSGACIAFLVFNFHPARIFMGDSGSMFLGLTLSVLALKTSSGASTSIAGAVLFPSLALAIPIFDTAFVTIMRRMNGRAISAGGCDHTSHRLVRLGLSEPQAVMVLYGACIIVGLTGIASVKFEADYLLLVGVFAAAWLLSFGKFLAQVDVYPSSSANPEGSAQFDSGRLYKRQFAAATVDALVCFGAMLITGILLALAGVGKPNPVGPINFAVLGVAAASVGLAIGGVYRGQWHHLRHEDFVRLAKGSFIAGAIIFPTVSILRSLELGLYYSAVAVVLMYSFTIASRALYRIMARVMWKIIHRRLASGKWVMVAPPNVSIDFIKGVSLKSGHLNPPFGIVTVADGGPQIAEVHLEGLQHLGDIGDIEKILSEIEPSAVLVAAKTGKETVEAVCKQKGVPCYLAGHFSREFRRNRG